MLKLLRIMPCTIYIYIYIYKIKIYFLPMMYIHFILIITLKIEKNLNDKNRKSYKCSIFVDRKVMRRQ